MKIPKQIRENNTKYGSVMNRKCSIKDCNNTASKTVSEQQYGSYIQSLRYKYDDNKYGKIYLCRHHQTIFNKAKKKNERYMTKKGFLENSNKFKRFKHK